MRRFILAGALGVSVLAACSNPTPLQEQSSCSKKAEFQKTRAGAPSTNSETEGQPNVQSRKDDCIEQCHHLLPTPNGDGSEYFKCLNRCMNKGSKSGQEKK